MGETKKKKKARPVMMAKIRVDWQIETIRINVKKRVLLA